MKKYIIIVLFLIIILILAGAYFIFQKNQNNTNNNFNFRKENLPTQIDISNLLLPFEIKDIDEQNGEVNPLGVVRFSKDRSEFGHSGIDIPLKKDSNIYSVAEGEVVLIDSSGDPWGGMEIFQLLSKTAEGEGWIFGYEHVTPVKGLGVGSFVKKGELIAIKTAPANFTAHFQFHKGFNNYKYKKDYQCWPDLLTEEENNKLTSWWDEYRNSKQLLDSWNTTADEGKFMFRGLLDKSKYPDGPQLCYPQGTDVR